MGLGHDIAPDLGRHLSAIDVCGGVVVIAQPDPADKVRSIPHEQGIAVALRGAGLAGHRPVPECCTGSGPRLNAGLEHVVHHAHLLIGQDPPRARRRLFVKDFPVRRRDARDDVGDRPVTAIGEGDIGVGQLEKRNLLRAQGNCRHGLEIGGKAQPIGCFDNVFRSDGDGQARRDRVDRIGERIAQENRPDIATVRVFRRPAIIVERFVHHQGVGRIALLQSGEIDDGLERRARLTTRRHRAVVGAGAVIDATHKSPHPALGVHGHERGLREAEAFALLGHRFLDHEFGVLLQLPIERGGNHHVFVHLAQIVVHERFHPVGDVIFGARHALGGDLGVHIGRSRLGLLLGDKAGPHHVGEGQLLTRPGPVGMGLGVIIARCGQDARQHGGLSQREIARRDAEIGLGRRLDTRRPRAEMHAVEVELENLVL